MDTGNHTEKVDKIIQEAIRQEETDITKKSKEPMEDKWHKEVFILTETHILYNQKLSLADAPNPIPIASLVLCQACYITIGVLHFDYVITLTLRVFKESTPSLHYCVILLEHLLQVYQNPEH